MIRNMRKRLGLLWSSVSFRLTLNYGLLAILTTLILVVFIYFQFMSAFHVQRYRQIEQTGQRLVAVFHQSGRAGLARMIELTLSDRIDSDREVYLLLDEQGHRLVGNLDVTPAAPLVSSEVAEASVVIDGMPARGDVKRIPLPDGATLFVGHDTRELDAISSLIARSVMVAVFAALLLIAVGTVIFRRELEYRVSTIRRTTEKISDGELSQRIPLSGVEDEFSYLNRDINTMLDRIEALMNGVRYVSDTIAHNLRTPLMRVLGSLRKAQQPGHSVEDVQVATQNAIDEIENLNVLFGKLLQITEMEAGVQRQAFRPCGLDVIVRDVTEMYEAYAEDKGLRVQVEVQAPIPVHADPDLIASALVNLLDNAMKYAASAVAIHAFELPSGQACVVVQDDGPGVPADELDRLGTRFYRRNSAYPGYGLGLSSVLAIVRLHDGTLTFSDAGPGLRATICLPVTD